MKRIFILFVVISLLVTLISCSKSAFNESTTAELKRVIEVVDQYYDLEITADEAYDKIDQIRERANFDTVYDGEDDSKKRLVESNVQYILIQLSAPSRRGPDDKEILECRNEIAEYIGEPIKN